MATTETEDEVTEVEPLSNRVIYAHGTMGVPLAVIGYPLAIWIPAHYSGGLGISLAMVGTILMLARFTDVITDPLIGELSDRYRTRFGRRKPWILLGMPIMLIGVYKLFIPPEGVGIFYFLFFLTVFFLGATLIHLGSGIVAGLPSALASYGCQRTICTYGPAIGSNGAYGC